MVGFYSGFSGGTNGISDSVAYTASFKVKKISPNFLFPQFEYTDTALALSFRCNSATIS